ncbi:filamentous hemagglutinin N-terminal domain-containing protein [Burkholderia sp. JSH-S8]|nr:filamentous hemagglutinin N-terminal domain-containing protein [Burkholderia sp. JSH-S8]
MNRAYSLVWNDAQGGWCAVGETARRRGKSRGGKQLIAAAGVSLLGLAASSAFALPTGGEIAAGKADIATSTDGKTMSINQHTDKLVTNWQDFSVGGGERVSFHQLSNQSIALNRVIGTNGSQIHGQIDANGKVFVVNPNGVVFGAGAQVNVGGLVASTKNISDRDFLAGTYRFAGASGQSVENAGTITAADGGSVALLGARVSNTGVIRAQAGRVALGAGNAFNVNFDGNGLLNLQVEGGAMDAQVNNGGLLKADGGEVLMTARAANGLLNAVVNNSGTVEAQGLNARDGKIVLDGGLVQVGGKLNAAGGTVTTRGERVAVSRDAQVDTRGASGRTGTWTIEAANANVSAAAPEQQASTRGLVIDGGVNGNTGNGGADGAIDGTTLSRNLDTTNVALTNTSGDLTVGDAVSWTSDHALTLTSKNGSVDLKQSVKASGANAGVTANAARGIRIDDKLALTGENANLALNSGSGHTLTNDNAAVTLSGRNASFSSNGDAYQVIHDVAGLRNVDANLNGRYVLGNAIDGKGMAFRSIGANQSFNGVFDGLGNTVGNLTVTNPGAAVVGLFAVNHGRIANLGLEKITARVSVPNGGSPVSVGALAGYNMGDISNVKAKDVVVSGSGRAVVGGLVGSNLSGTIDRASVSGRVEGGRDAVQVGGLVGENLTVLWPDRGQATISNSHANVQVVSQSTGGTGGLVGFNRGIVSASTAAGSISAHANGARVGGLVGVNESGVVKASSSSANVRANHAVVAGGLVGYNGASIEASAAIGSVTVGNNGFAGGLVGDNRGKVDASTAGGNVVAGVSGVVGGLVGTNGGTILASTANGGVKAGNAATAGGLAGHNAGIVNASTANGSVDAGAGSVLGGLVGNNANKAEVIASHAHGNVSGRDSVKAGGLAGVNLGIVKSSDASGRVTVGVSSIAGGLVGENHNAVVASTAAGNVSTGSNGNAGGLVGHNAGTVTGAGASGAVTVAGAGNAGGLVGLNRGSVSSSSASGDVVAGAEGHVGGLVGENVMGASIESSSASGSATSGNNGSVGGLVGGNGGKIASSSASGTVSGGRGALLGGVAGGNFGTVERSTASGRIAYTAGYGQHYGGLAGVNTGWMRGNTVTGSAAAVPLAGINFGDIRN